MDLQPHGKYIEKHKTLTHESSDVAMPLDRVWMTDYLRSVLFTDYMVTAIE